MIMFKKIIILSLLTSYLLIANGIRTINFAPLPMVKSQKLLEQYLPMLEYLEKEVSVKFNILYVQNYNELLNKLGTYQIDLSFLGPLPYAEASSRYPHIQPLVRFLDAQGKDHYTCTLFKLQDSPLDMQTLSNKNFALTQKYSTCGFLATQKILNDHNHSLTQNLYNFSGSHTNAILEVVLGNSDLGCAKSSIVHQYQHFGLKTLAISDPFPSFLLVYHTHNIPQKIINQIKEALMKLQPLSNSQDANTTQKWGKNLKYGVVEAKDSDYNTIRRLLQTIELPK